MKFSGVIFFSKKTPKNIKLNLVSVIVHVLESKGL